MTTENRAMFRTNETAPEGHLKWLMEDPEGGDNVTTNEAIPRAYGFYYELSYDEEGLVFPAIVMRDDEGEPISGVTLGQDELMSFARWAFQTGLSVIRLQTVTGFTVSDVSIRNYLSAHVKDLFTFVKGELPDQYDEVIEDSAEEAIEKAVQRAERDAEVRLRAAVIQEREATERRFAQHIVQLSKAATLPVAERSEALDDPILQDVVKKAVTCLADSNRT